MSGEEGAPPAPQISPISPHPHQAIEQLRVSLRARPQLHMISSIFWQITAQRGNKKNHLGLGWTTYGVIYFSFFISRYRARNQSPWSNFHISSPLSIETKTGSMLGDRLNISLDTHCDETLFARYNSAHFRRDVLCNNFADVQVMMCGSSTHQTECGCCVKNCPCCASNGVGAHTRFVLEDIACNTLCVEQIMCRLCPVLTKYGPLCEILSVGCK